MDRQRVLLHLDLPPRPELILDAVMWPHEDDVADADVSVSLRPADDGSWEVEFSGPQPHVSRLVKRLATLQAHWDAVTR